jgi:hypothetical protein
MSSFGKVLSAMGLALGMAFVLSASDQKTEAQQRDLPNAPTGGNAPATGRNAPTSIPMGGNKSVTRFFVTSKGLGKGGDLAGADAHCQALAQAQGAGGDLIAPHLAVLHGSQIKLAKDTALTEISDEVSA